MTAKRATNPDFASVYLLKGSDESLLRDAVRDLVERLVGDGDRSLMVEEVTIDGSTIEDREPQLATLVDSARTPPFLTDRRIVVGRGVSAATAGELGGVAEAIRDPLTTTVLVLTWDSGKLPKAMQDALKAVGAQTIDASPARPGAAQKTWVADHLAASGLHLDAGARELVAERIGEDAARLAGIIDTLTSTFGSSARLGADDVEPYLGEAGSIPPWELTDAIDAGNIAGGLDRLQRQMQGGGLAGLQVLGTLHRHYSRMLALDGADVTNERDAAAALGIDAKGGKSYPARKALDQTRRLGSARLQQAIGLLARADRDLKGERTYPADVADRVILELLVARLAHLSATAR